jgi:CDP-diacylglycerol--glycerol-3-phosphate 3-phosphatidyltransferase
MKQIPFLLIYSRILIAVIIGFLAVSEADDQAEWIVSLMIFGLLTDVFDGIIARKLNVSTEKLRIWDSNVDQFFWIVVIGSIFYLKLGFIKENLFWIGLVVFLEVLSYLISYGKFKRSIATHSILAKIWTLSLLAFLIDLALNSSSNIPFMICIGLGILSRMEIILIILRLNKWTTDVPSIFAVSKLNRGNR